MHQMLVHLNKIKWILKKEICHHMGVRVFLGCGSDRVWSFLMTLLVLTSQFCPLSLNFLSSTELGKLNCPVPMMKGHKPTAPSESWCWLSHLGLGRRPLLCSKRWRWQIEEKQLLILKLRSLTFCFFMVWKKEPWANTQNLEANCEV